MNSSQYRKRFIKKKKNEYVTTELKKEIDKDRCVKCHSQSIGWNNKLCFNCREYLENIWIGIWKKIYAKKLGDHYERERKTECTIT